MSKVEDKTVKHSVLKNIRKRFQIKGYTIPILFFLVVLILESCATHYKHRKYKHVPCPCETEQRR